ncbi:hypothetical protein ACOMHN_067674 [Nucella lapillus]
MAEPKKDNKRAATSLQADTNKKTCLSSNDGEVDSEIDNDGTIVNTDFLSSTFVAGTPHMGHEFSAPRVEDLKAALGDPDILELISKAVAAQVVEPLRKEISGLRKTLTELHSTIESKEQQIMKLQDRVDELEQYGRRNSVRITSVPEVKGESTDDVVKALCKQIDIEIADDMIDRSHRVGRQPSVGEAKTSPIWSTSAPTGINQW